MLIMAHAGITLGSAYLLERVFRFRLKNNKQADYDSIHIENSQALSTEHVNVSNTKVLSSTASSCMVNETTTFRIDYRFILLGSILPDLIDKPVGNIFFVQIFNNGRIFSHTLLFLLLAILIAILIFRTRMKLWGFCIAFGVLVHLLLDAMWLEPVTLFWPILGFSFYVYPEMGLKLWINGMLYDLIVRSDIYISEIMGAVILIFFTVKLVIEKKVKKFFRSGDL